MNMHVKRSMAAVICFMLFVFAGCSAKVEPAMMDPTVYVETVKAETGELSTEGTYVGTISAEDTARVVSLVSATVEDIYVTTGDTVSAGDMLCQFDDEAARLTYESAAAGHNSALQAYNSAVQGYNSTVATYGGEDLDIVKAQVDMAQENYDATLELHKIGAASKIEVDQAKQALDSAKAGLEATEAGLIASKASVQTAQAGVRSAEVGLSSAEYQLSLYQLSAPISGVVESVSVKENNFAPSGTVAFVISNSGNKTVTFYVTDDVMKEMTVGQTVKVSARNGEFDGAVCEIGGMVDSMTGMFKVKALIDNAKDIPDGLSVSVTTVSNTEKDAIIIPADALYFENGEAYVYVVSEDVAVKKYVSVALYTKELIAITDGISEGDVVITSWTSALKDGSPVVVPEKEDKGDENVVEGAE